MRTIGISAWLAAWIACAVPAGGAGAEAASGDYTFYQHAAWSPDGERFALSVYRGGRYAICLMEVGSSPLEQITDGDDDMWATWAPDGRRIAFTSKKFGSRDIWAMTVDGAWLSRLTTGEGDESAPSWSPDGRHIAYIARMDDLWQIFVMNSDGSDQRRLHESDTNDYNPRWSPDGTHLVFYATDAAGEDRVCTIDADGGSRRVLADGVFPDWAPDGKSVVYDKDKVIYIMNADGSDVGRFVDDGFGATWSPDGTRIAFIRSALPRWPTPSEVFVVDALGPHAKAVTGIEDDSLPSVVGQITRIDDYVPRDGGVTIHIIDDAGKPLKLYFGSLYTRPPPTRDRIELYETIKTLRAGDRIEARGKASNDGFGIVTLKKLPGRIEK